MRAAVYRRFGTPDVVRVEQLPRPVPRRGEVLVRVHASTVSVADHRARSLDIPSGLRIPAAPSIGVFRPRHRVLGMDVAGVVAAIGADVSRFAVGDEVIAMMGARFGGHAEYAVVSQDGAITAKPRTMSFEEAVTLVFGGVTARGFLKQVTITAGDTVLVNGASGAVGTAAVQLAKELGADVTGVTSFVNRELVSSLGADHIIDYTTDDFTAQNRRYNVIIDCVGNAPFEKVTDLITPGGALLLVISDLRSLLGSRRQSRRSGKIVTADVGPARAEDLAHLVGLAEAGRYTAVIDRSYDLADIVEAHRYVDTGRKKGNVVLRLTTPTPHHLNEGPTS
ncbi:NADPH:quinone reductase-like Zn-dependent oxidoreductase [Homoserinimonas aerilata]|uniref:NADPH:quinone reductase-like Zn-dependent oxidoreductase n=2 Tax=Homoserinimonas aerilata TaxID=1162970 RepID=A0A542YH76_9MICO|nr:NADPH:quinone reductase-like Zn-dependent oxidoreductase [Homoserinimonas aerilata]